MQNKYLFVLIHIRTKGEVGDVKNSTWEWSGNTTITKQQTNPWYREEELHNHRETPGRQTKQSNQLSLPHQDDRKTRMDIK